jgi:hypothetical protein
MKELEDRVLGATRAAITAFVKKNPRARIARLFFDGTPPYDNVGICFDTEASARRTEPPLERAMLVERRRLTYEHWEFGSRNAAAAPWLGRFDVSEFSHQTFVEVHLPEYAAYAASPAAPPDRPGIEPWSSGVLRILFTRVIDRLVDDGAFARVPCAPTLWLGYSLHDDTPALVRTVVAKGRASSARDS